MDDIWLQRKVRFEAKALQATTAHMGPKTWNRISRTEKMGQRSIFSVRSYIEELRAGWIADMHLTEGDAPLCHIYIVKDIPEGVVVYDRESAYELRNFEDAWLPRVHMRAEKDPPPTTLEEAVLWLGAALGPEDRACVLRNEKDFTSIQVKIQVLRWIRNELGLWTGSELYDHLRGLGYEHPDDMSGRIYDEFVRSGGRGLPGTRFDRPDPV